MTALHPLRARTAADHSGNTARHNGDISFWYSQNGGAPIAQNRLEGDADADVCIVGGGFTGLWTAYYLKQAQPALNVRVLEANFAGYGASGRNGGWLTGLVPGARSKLAELYGFEAARALQLAIIEAIDEVISVALEECIFDNIHKVGTIRIARNSAQSARMDRRIAEEREWGVLGVARLSASEVRDRVAVNRVVGGMYNPHCARVQPATLVRGLAAVAVRHGAVLNENSPVTDIRPGLAVTPGGNVRAPIILRATEGYTSGIKGLRRVWIPMGSSVVATDRLPDWIWGSIGWDGRETLGDLAHSHVYLQRTDDDRIIIGGRGIPYRFASRTDESGRTHARTIGKLVRVLKDFFPQLTEFGVDHAWCGVLAVPRDWCPTVAFDRSTGLGWAGGFVGQGVTASNLAARTLRDLVLGRKSPLADLAWVNHRPRPWEPEPLRWMGVRGLYMAYSLADWTEDRNRHGSETSSIARIADLFVGPHT